MYECSYCHEIMSAKRDARRWQMHADNADAQAQSIYEEDKLFGYAAAAADRRHVIAPCTSCQPLSLMADTGALVVVCKLITPRAEARGI